MGMIDRALACSGLNVSAPAWPPPSLSLALQGGGSFGAFTWGVLDRLLEEPGVNFDSNSRASAGAVNAVLLASGMIDGGRAEAKARLKRFWRQMSNTAALLPSSVLAACGFRRSRPRIPIGSRPGFRFDVGHPAFAFADRSHDVSGG